MKRRLVTSALPYVNNEPHLGNLIQVLSADCFARFCRLRGYETLYICGTDEYGTATETRAASEGITERELCGRYWALHDEIYRWFTISFDKFGRTSTPLQTEITQDIFKKIDERGLITEHTESQPYCPSCKRFLADRYVRGACPHCGYENARGDQCENCGKLLDPADLKNPQCSTCGSPPEVRQTRHLYINLPKNKERLAAWIAQASKKGRWSRNAVLMTEGWLRDGLHERAITRDLKWGIPVPRDGYENKVFYVWFDAPIGYISITANWAADLGLDWKSAVDKWWKSPEDVELFQFIGKDNIPFHTVIFPSSLLGTGENWTMLHHMSSTEYLNYESGKFSKSEGRGVFGSDAEHSGIPSDVWRFYIFYNRPEKSDSLFTWKDFAEKVNSELIGNLGNLVNRTLSFVTRYYDGDAPEPAGDETFWKRVRELESEITELLEWAELRGAYHKIFELSDFANKYFQAAEPWKKRTEAPEEAKNIIGNLTSLLADIAILIQSYTPVSAEKLAGFLGYTLEKNKPNSIDWQFLGKARRPGCKIKSEVLFSKLDEDFISSLREKFDGTQIERNEKSASINKNFKKENSAKDIIMDITIEEKWTQTVDLRTAEIVNVEKHPNADKLFVITLDIAGEERVIVSGLVGHYTEAELLHKHIIVAYNLKPAKLRGTESRGMLLAAEIQNADGSEIVEVLDSAGIPSGTQVKVAGINDGAPLTPIETIIDIDKFLSFPMAVKNNIAEINGKALMLGGKPVKTERIANGEIH